MKKERVLSVRLSYKTIAQCYSLASGGLDPSKLTMSGVICATLEAILEGLEKLGKVPKFTDDEAKEYIAKFLPDKAWPGLDITEAATQDLVGLLQEKAQGRERQHQRHDEQLKLPVQDPQLEERIIDHSSLLSRIEAIAKEQEKATEIELSNVVEMGRVYRDTPEEIETVQSTPPWEGAQMVKVEKVKEDKVYKAALVIKEKGDELVEIAVRVAYTAIPESMWGSKKAVELVKSTYEAFRRWKDESSSN